jgi:hypothetical protein
MADSIHIKKSHEGLLHKKLGMKKDSPIPVSELHAKLAAAKKRGDVKEERELVFAINAHHFHHNKG